MTNIMRSTRRKSSLNKQRLHNRNIKENKIQSILNTATLPFGAQSMQARNLL